MYRPLLCLLLVISLIHRNESQQLQMTQDVEDLKTLTSPEDSCCLQVEALQRNITALWTYIYELRGAVTHHLNHLREHQVEMESTIHRLEHHGDEHGDTHAAHTADHSHSGEDHSHGHGSDSHSHGSDQHSHSDEHHHHHSGEHHSHGGDEHAHSDEHRSHSHTHESHSHSHSGSDHSTGHEDDHHHGHKDSHESEDEQQQTQQVSEPLVEPVIVATNVRSHSHYHPTPASQSSVGQTGSSRFQPLNVMGEDSHHHHHHTHDKPPTTRNRTRVVYMPKYSDYDLFEFAVCNMQPNRAIPVDQQQSVVGQISLWQKKTEGPLNIHVRLSGFAMGDHHAHHQQVQQEEDNETPAPVTHKHGMHVHSLGDLSNGCQSTGSHFNPKSANHGGPNALVRHVGDLGNIECDEHGVANLVFSDQVASLKGQYSIIGKSMVIHSGEDDYGLGNNEESLRTGNAGTRIACCVIEKVEKLPIRSYKAMKTAIQYQNR